MTKNHTSALDISALTEKEENSKVSINRFQFLFDNPFLLQDILSREKQIPPDQLKIDWVLHPDRPVAQTVSLIRLQRSYLAARFHVRINSEFRVLAMPPNLVFPYNSCEFKWSQRFRRHPSSSGRISHSLRRSLHDTPSPYGIHLGNDRMSFSYALYQGFSFL